MIENFITAFIVYFVVIDPVGTAPIFLAITTHLNKRQKIRTALEGSFVAGAIMLFFALCGVWILHYLNISLTAFRLAGGIILLMVALDMLANKRQARREQGNDTISTDDNIAIFPLATPLLAGPAAITSVMVVAKQPCWQSRYRHWLWRNGCGDAGNSDRFNHCQPSRILYQPAGHAGLFAHHSHHFSRIVDSIYH